MIRLSVAFSAFLALALSGCAYTDFKHFAYDSLQSRQCLHDTGSISCDTDRIDYQHNELDYQTYKKERDSLVKQPTSNKK